MNTYEVISPTYTTDRSCELVSECGHGFEEIIPFTSTSDRVCDCIVGSFYRNSTKAICTPCIECKSDIEYESAPCTVSTDRVCREQPECDYVSEFTETPSEFELSPPTSTSARVCQKTKSCDLNSSFIVQLATPTSDTICQDISVCPAGSKQFAPATKLSDTDCISCNGVSEYQDEEGQLECKATRRCDDNSFTEVLPTTTTDRRCRSCRQCLTEFEFELTPCTASSDRVCQPSTECRGSSYRPAGASASSPCVPFTICPPSDFEVGICESLLLC